VYFKIFCKALPLFAGYWTSEGSNVLTSSAWFQPRSVSFPIRCNPEALIGKRLSKPWMSALQSLSSDPAGQRLVRLSWPGDRQAEFPARLDGSLCVDPLSLTAQPLWDLLVTAGRLDALTSEEARVMSYGKWEDPILGLAGAYALYATGSDLVLTVLSNLRVLQMKHPDVTLLKAADAVHRLGAVGQRNDAVSSLASSSAVPVLRWGIPIARVLAQSVPPVDAVTRWDALLATVERTLSPTSVWTAWTTSATIPAVSQVRTSSETNPRSRGQ
jgi:hypothetical protein